MDEFKESAFLIKGKTEPALAAELLTYANPRLKEYRQLIEQIGEVGGRRSGFYQVWDDLRSLSVAGGERLSEQETRDIQSAAEYFKEVLGGERLVDCGGGEGQMSRFAHWCGAKAYINIDIRRSEDSFVPLSGDMPVIVVQRDLLEALALLPSNFANLTINGIDRDVIIDVRYHKNLARELARVAKKIIFGHHCDSLAYLEEREEVAEQCLNFFKLGFRQWYGARIFEKVANFKE